MEEDINNKKITIMESLVELKVKKISLANIENRLTAEEMEKIMAGSFSHFVNGFCGGVGAAAGVMALTGVGAPAAVATLAYAGIACGGLSLFW